ncbi:MAG: M20/M25/M40 family metallo-hydrolase, partial [Clostridia bacterium]|nr:M20/M25/M40 family metallo-hydrolase [Clostridia bacterium]
MDIMNEFRRFLDENWDTLVSDCCELAQIPAPSHHEEQRVEWVKNYFERWGAENVIVDDALNVILPLGAESDQLDVYMAHTDVVFPDTDPLPLVREDGFIRCPGIGDDTAHVAIMLLVARFILEKKLRPKTGVLIVANSCEEGLGNLKGARRLCDDYGKRMRSLITFDSGLNNAVDVAVGSQRYRVTVKTEGGHSFGKFGNRNAIVYLSRMIDTLYQMKAPDYGKTTYNVGLIEGGTSVNTIAQEASMLFEFRSDDARVHMGKKNSHRRIEHWHIIALLLGIYDLVAVNVSYFLALWFRFDCRFSEIPGTY